jgi:hypothetical protein
MGVTILEKSRVCKSLEALNKRLNEESMLLIQKLEGLTREVSFYFSDPLSEEEINRFCAEYQVSFPDDYKEFMLMSNGADLFYDDAYGSGVSVLSLENIVNVIKEDEPPNHLLPIVSITDWGFLFVDCERWNRGEKDYLVWREFGYSFDEVININSNFGLWFDRIIVAQGAVFWDWHTYRAGVDF